MSETRRISDQVIADYQGKAADYFAKFENTTTVYFNFFIDRIAPPPASVLDIGSGSGKDAAVFAQRGYDVVAIEPAESLRFLAQKKHLYPNITWLDDRLPYLENIKTQDILFDHIHINSVLFHLPLSETRRVLETCYGLLKDKGTLFITLRLGPPDPARPMFPVDKAHVTTMSSELFILINAEHIADDLRPNIVWDHLLLQKLDLTS
jgi:2-polyprenyl-3-methyl-5-hydroxy-6-metoxy-1,4-benzoquinol methylase